ncbi:MAG: hypothetical protein ABI461_00245 [Polyangiaceae bacterium]
MNNPYAAPQASPGPPPPPTLRLFTPIAVAVHAAIFPWLGAFLATVNYFRLKQRPAALRMFFAYFVPSVFINVLTSRLPSAATALAFRGLSLGLAWLLYRDQMPVVGPALVAGATPARWYIGWFIVFPIVFFLFLVVWQFLSPIPKH